MRASEDNSSVIQGYAAGVAGYRKYRKLVMLGLGFASGLPYPLAYATLAFWLSEQGVSISKIAMLSWVMLPYSLKFLWFSYCDRSRAPFIGQRAGHRQGWIIICLTCLIICLATVGALTERHQLAMMASVCIVTAFLGATLDASIDALRIESQANSLDGGRLLTSYQIGYRASILISDGLIFLMSARFGWHFAYLFTSCLLLLPLLGAVRFGGSLANICKLPSGGLISASGKPCSKLVWLNAPGMLIALGVVAIYRAPDLIITPVINPLYYVAGVTKAQVGLIHSVSIPFSVMGIFVAGMMMGRINIMRILLIGAGFQTAAMFFFYLLATHHGLQVAMIANVVENFSSSYTGTALVALMSTMVRADSAGFDYALLTCAYSFIGKLFGGFSGFAVAAWGANSNGYANFFVFLACASVGVCLLVHRVSRIKN
ncbi:ABC transporter permease [Xanthomonas campestris pv. paulliniae]|uniref:ABC transporter permease n=1 Tax=Xanthomonas euvesicatoria TaxID=456327 RepID=UPI001C47EFDB|nr:ABC transporter permease [Xanthomonas euvesicatoria]MBV6845782.1 ABC transporter permease [Xanthomonas campestris pv. paulliniae]